MTFSSTISSSITYENGSSSPTVIENGDSINPYSGTEYDSNYNAYNETPSLVNVKSEEVINGNRVGVPTSLSGMKEYMQQGYEIIRIDPQYKVQYDPSVDFLDLNGTDLGDGSEPVYLVLTEDGKGYRYADEYGNVLGSSTYKGGGQIFTIEGFVNGVSEWSNR